MVRDDNKKTLLDEVAFKSVRRLLANAVIAASYVAIGSFLSKFAHVTFPDSFAINLSFKIVQYAFVVLALIFLAIHIFQEAFTIISRAKNQKKKPPEYRS
jgi:predicted permease